VFNYWALSPNALPTPQAETDYCRHCLSVWDVSFRKRSLIVLAALALVFAGSLYAYTRRDVPGVLVLMSALVVVVLVLVWSSRFVEIRLKFPAQHETPTRG
jgi:hypothetical protein